MKHITNVGNIDISATGEAVVLRMRHVVEGHPGCCLGHAEVRTLIQELQALVDRKPTAETTDDLEDLLG